MYEKAYLDASMMFSLTRCRIYDLYMDVNYDFNHN